MAIRKPEMNRTGTRWLLISGLVAVAFFASYGFAVAQGGPSASRGSGGQSAGGDTSGADLAAGGCSCCGGTSAPAEASDPEAAVVEGDVQRISVDVTKGYYDPSVIELKAGVPAEITFSESGGCTAQVQSRELGFAEDLSSGPKTVKLPALEPGTYGFECGMSMVFGSIVVK